MVVMAEHEYAPRLVEALVGKKVVGAATGCFHTAVWTDTGELFAFGRGHDGKAGPWRGREWVYAEAGRDASREEGDRCIGRRSYGSVDRHRDVMPACGLKAC